MELDDLDWPPGPSQRELRRLDELARCPVCHEFYKVPLSLSCGHSYCSTCIRGNLDYQERHGGAKCPQCRHPCDTRDLRPCLALKAVVETYAMVRRQLIEAANQTAPAIESSSPAAPRRTSGRLQKRLRDADAGASTPQGRQQQQHMSVGAAGGASARGGGSGKEGAAAPASTRRKCTVIDMTQDEEGGRQLRPQPATPKPADGDQADRAEAESDIEGTLSTDSSWGSGPPSQRTRSSAQIQEIKGRAAGGGRKAGSATGQPNRIPPGYVECPVCTMQLRETLVNDHIDKCLQKMTDNNDFQARPARSLPAPADRVAKGGKAKLEVPPKLVFSMLSNKELQAKLRAYKLSTDGKRHDWEQRYNKYRVEVECAKDAGEHITLEEIARRLGKKEKHTAAAAFVAPRTKVAVKGASSFEELISRTREREAKRPPAAEQEFDAAMPEASLSEPLRKQHTNAHAQPSFAGAGAVEHADTTAGNLQSAQRAPPQQDGQPEAQSMAASRVGAGPLGKAEDRSRFLTGMPLDPLDPNVHLALHHQPAPLDHVRANGACRDASGGKAEGSARHCRDRGFAGQDDAGLICESHEMQCLDEIPDSGSEEE